MEKDELVGTLGRIAAREEARFQPRGYEERALQTELRESTYREHRVLQLYYGIGEESHTLAEVGEKFGVTGERIRQVKEQALDRLAERMTERGY